jgi:predicted esterase
MRSILRPLLLVFALAGVVAVPAAAEEPPAAPPAAAPPPTAAPTAKTVTFSKGKLIENVPSASDPSQTYVLYIPTSYNGAKPVPVLFVLDPRGRAMLAAKLFRPAAEKYGWLMLSSYNSASDGPIEPNIKAMQAMWNDTNVRFKVDPKRIYAAGFSGTARTACTMGTAVPGSITGVIAAGAGFSADVPPRKDTSFAFYGAIGDLDFNYHELLQLEETLTALGLSHRIEVFAGPHRWMPEELATAGVEWMELQAMRAGTRPVDAAWVEQLWARESERAHGLEAAGRVLDAAELYRALAHNYQGLRDVTAAAEKAAQLADSKAGKEQLKERKAETARSERYVRDAQQVIASSGADPGTVGAVLNGLQIASLRGRAQKSETLDGRSAQRLLNSVAVQVGFYLPQQALAQKDWSKAAFYLTLATEIAPDDPFNWLGLAAAHAKAGQRKRALEELQRAAEKGLRNPALIEEDDSFDGLRDEPAYKAALEQVQKAQAAATPVVAG